MATQLLGQNTGCSPVSLTPTLVTSAGSASLSGGTFFYSNNPEPVTSSNGIADAGHWLMKAQVSGTGQVFLWHQNQTGASQNLNTELLIYNPNNYTITLSSSNYGLTNNSSGEGVDGWLGFYNGQTTSTTVNPLSWGSLFYQSVPNNNIWGVVARLDIHDSLSNPASAVLYDLAWLTNSGGATAYANPDTSSGSTQRRRGTGSGANGYWASVNISTLYVQDLLQNGAKAFNLAALGDSVGAQDIPYITDPSGQVSGYLNGAFGMQLYVTLPISNNTLSSHTVRLFAGNQATCSVLVAIDAFGGPGGCSNTWLGTNRYLDMIEDTIPANTTPPAYTFQIVVPGGSCAPLTVGARVTL